MTVDEHVDSGDLVQQVDRAVAGGSGLIVDAQVAQADDVVAALVLAQHIRHILCDLVQLLTAGEGHALDLTGVGLCGGLRGVQTEHADLGAAGGGEHGRIVKGQLAVVLHVGGQHGELGVLHVLLQCLKAVVELVVAKRHSVVAHHVHQLHSRCTLRHTHSGVALTEVAGVQDQHIRALRLILAGQRRYLGVIGNSAVHIVGVQDDHRLRGGGVLAGVGFLFAAGRQGEHHGQGKQQRQQLFLHTPYSFLSAFLHIFCACCMAIVPYSTAERKLFPVFILHGFYTSGIFPFTLGTYNKNRTRELSKTTKETR